jgi:hypothetical protein
LDGCEDLQVTDVFGAVVMDDMDDNGEDDRKGRSRISSGYDLFCSLPGGDGFFSGLPGKAKIVVLL